jgi:hypothetical protein
MASENSETARLTERDRRLSNAFRDCRELLRRTEELLERAQHLGGPSHR